MNGKIYAVVAICGALIVGAFAPSFLGPLRAQLNAPQTWGGTAGGSINALTLTIPNVSAMADLLGVPIRFLPANANAAGVTTVNINGIGAQAVMRTSGGTLVPIAGGDFGSGSPPPYAEIMWDGTEFVQTNPATGTDPVGHEEAFTGAASQIPAGRLVENGVCISQTTYAALYASYGSTDLYSPGSTGSSCPGGQFHVKFANGRASVAADTQGSVTASVLTNAGSGCAATAPAVLCGAQSRSLAQGNLPNINFTGGVGSTSSGSAALGPPGCNFTGGFCAGGSFSAAMITPGATNTSAALVAVTDVSVNLTNISVPSGGSGTPVVTVQPISTVLMLVKY